MLNHRRHASHAMNNMIQCTDSSNGQNDYPKAWDKLPAQQQSGVFFNSAEECCDTYWNGPCVMTDYCKENNDDPKDEPEDEPEDESEKPKEEPVDEVTDPKDEPAKEPAGGGKENCESHEFWHPVTIDSTVDTW